MLTKIVTGLIALVAIVYFACAYTVDETQRGILFKFGEIKEADIKPGLH